MSLVVEGKLIKVCDTETKSGTFKSRDFIIEMPDGKYPQLVKFQLVQDKVDMIDQFLEGQEIKVHFNLRGKEWQGKYFTSLNAWKIE
jgi:single-strand DNA-binding protein